MNNHFRTTKKHCIQYMTELCLQQYFNEAAFKKSYKENKATLKNAYTAGLDAADYIILNSKPIYND